MMDIRNPVHTQSGDIDCEIYHNKLGWIPFTASPNDCDEIGRKIHKAILDGVAGQVLPAPPPAEKTPEEIIEEKRVAIKEKYIITPPQDVLQRIKDLEIILGLKDPD